MGHAPNEGGRPIHHRRNSALKDSDQVLLKAARLQRRLHRLTTSRMNRPLREVPEPRRDQSSSWLRRTFF
jgi:hypothetical protein